jgi:hypothetical protein
MINSSMPVVQRLSVEAGVIAPRQQRAFCSRSIRAVLQDRSFEMSNPVPNPRN